MITLDEAKAIAQSEIHRLAPKGIEVVITQIIEFNEGWVFYWNSQNWLETGNVLDGLLGNIPILIDKEEKNFYHIAAKHFLFDDLESPAYCSKLLKQFRKNKTNSL
jgi:hypothetical protein